MSFAYRLPELPTVYWILETLLECPACGTLVRTRSPVGNELVKFDEIDGSGERWLPTFTKGGYLDLLRTLVGVDPQQPVTMRVAREFQKRFSPLQEPCVHGNPFSMEHSPDVCPACGAMLERVVSENVLQNPPIDWLRYALP